MVRLRFRSRGLVPLMSLAPVFMGPFVGIANAAALSWNNAGGGAASTAANWSPSQIPVAADDLTFNLNNNFTVTYNASVASSRTHSYRRGNVTMSLSSPHTVGSGITIGKLAGDVATLTLTTGTLNSSTLVVLADVATSTGTLNVNDDDADFVINGTADSLIVGNRGVGNLNVTAGGLVDIGDRFFGASNVGSSAQVTVSGFTIAPVSRSTLRASGTNFPHGIGGGGSCTFTVSGGALADFAGDLEMASGSASNSSLTIGGAGLLPATVTIDGDFRIATNSSSGSAAGEGTVTVNTDGVLTVGGQLAVGNDPDGAASAVLRVTGDGAVTTHDLIIGPDGSLDFQGGTIDVLAGALQYLNPSAGFILGGPDNPLLTLQGSGASANLTTIFGSRAITVGGGAGAVSAEFDVRSGADVTIGAGSVVVGEGPGDSGKLLINGVGSTFTMPQNQQLTVGQGGEGWFEIELGGSADCGGTNVGANPGVHGMLVIESAGTTASFLNLALGGTFVAAGGTAEGFISSGAVVDCSHATMGLRVWPGGILHISGATVDCVGGADVDGLVDMSAGTIAVGGTLQLDGDMLASGTIDGRLQVGPAGLLTTNGNLVAGDSTNTAGVSIAGGVGVDGHTLTMLDSNQVALSGTLDLMLGGDVEAEHGLALTATGVLTGSGDVFASVNNAGLIQTTGVAGIRFHDFVNGVGQGITGTAIRFMSGGGLVAAGTLGTGLNVDADPGSEIIATGALSMGNVASTNGFICDGALNVGSHTVTLRDANTADLGGPVSIAGGTLQSTNGIRLTAAGSVTGFGQVGLGRFVSDAGSVIAATGGDLALGDPNRPSGVNIFGELHIGSHTVDLRSLTDVELGTLTTIAGGVLNGPTNPLSPFEIVNLHLSAGDVIQGFGTINDFVSGAAGSGIVATGPLELFGTVDSFPFAGSFDGTLNIGAQAVNCSGTTNLGGTVLMNGGSLAAGGIGLNLLGGSHLNGSGFVSGPQISAFGAISPSAGASQTGLLSISGPLSLEPGSILNIDIAGLAAGAQHDRIDVAGGPVELGGSLNVQFINGFEPVAGNSFIVMQFPSFTSQFAAFSRPNLDGRYLQLEYHPTFVRIMVRANQIGDTDCDGDSDFFDIDPFVAALSGEGPYLEQFPNCDWSNADADCDGDVDFFDIDPFVACLGGNCTCQ